MSDVAFKSQRFVTFGQDSYTCRLVESFFKKNRFTPQTLTYMGSMEAIKAFVKLGQGVSLMPAWVAKQEIDTGCLRALPTGSDDLKRRWGITHRRGQLLGDMEETFWRLCQASVHNKSIEGYPIKTFPMKLCEQPVAEI
jgi:DNA-binding transcriptional LysR family regulator